MIIAVAIEGLKLGPCAEYLSRETPNTVKKLFDEMRKFAKSEEDLHRRKANRKGLSHTSLRQPQYGFGKQPQPHSAVNNLQDATNKQQQQTPLEEQAPGQRDGGGNRGGRSNRGGRGKQRGRGPKVSYCFVCGENAEHISRDCKYSQMAKEQRMKDEAARNAEPPKHVFYSTSYASPQTSSSAFQQYSLPAQQTGYAYSSYQNPYVWQLPPSNNYPAASHLARQTVAPAPAQQSGAEHLQQQQPNTQQVVPKQENNQELQVVNTVMPTNGHIYAITGGSNLEHESKRARKDYQRRVLTVSPRLPLNRPAWAMVPITFDETDF